MQTRSPALAAILAVALLAGCAVSGQVVSPPSPLIGAWLVTSERSRGVGKNMLTFSGSEIYRDAMFPSERYSIKE